MNNKKEWIPFPHSSFHSRHQQQTIKVSKLNSPIVSLSDITEECGSKNDRSSTITMALINMQSTGHSCSNSSTLCVYWSVCESPTEWENGTEWAYSDSLGALENINRFCFVTLNRLKGINAWDRVEEKRPPSKRKKDKGSGVWWREMLKLECRTSAYKRTSVTFKPLLNKVTQYW